MWHERQGIAVTTQVSDEKWQPNDTYTVKRSCDAYGMIEFRGFGQEALRRVPVSVHRWDA